MSVILVIYSDVTATVVACFGVSVVKWVYIYRISEEGQKDYGKVSSSAENTAREREM